jgi:anti-sigma factor RsiW
VTSTRKLTCRELIAFLIDYIDGTLAGDELASFDAHLAVCPDCVNYLDAYRATVRAGRAAFADPDEFVPDAVPEELVAAILETRRRI